MFLRSTRLPLEGQMLYIFLHIDSTQGGWGRGMGNKSDKVSPSLCLSLSRFYPLCPRWLKLYLLHFLLSVFFPAVTCYSAPSAFLLHCVSFRPLLNSVLGGLRNNRPDVLVLELWLGCVLTKSAITSR